MDEARALRCYVVTKITQFLHNGSAEIRDPKQHILLSRNGEGFYYPLATELPAHQNPEAAMRKLLEASLGYSGKDIADWTELKGEFPGSDTERVLVVRSRCTIFDEKQIARGADLRWATLLQLRSKMPWHPTLYPQGRRLLVEPEVFTQALMAVAACPIS